jgi:hypothetical protein
MNVALVYRLLSGSPTNKTQFGNERISSPTCALHGNLKAVSAKRSNVGRLDRFNRNLGGKGSPVLDKGWLAQQRTMSSVNLDPKGPFKRDALVPQQMRDRVTRTDETIVLCHLGVPRFQQDQWSLLIDGMVERTRVLSLEELLRYPRIDIGAVHQCCGSPLAPFDTVGNGRRRLSGDWLSSVV